ncbi:MAG: DUF2177 family protein [Hoeflea sp.]|uniref:DUF2177 family protein n=1 Tax=Hoeflea sp. TaxID=1940281 RepID=UPI0032ED4D40
MIPVGFFKAWAASAAFFLVIDAIWLGLVAKSFYRDQLGGLMADSVNFPVAAIFYVMFSAAAVILASATALRTGGGLLDAALLGAILGFAAYGTYDFTNLATLKNWPVAVTAVDIVWGTALTSAASAVGFWVLRAVQGQS